MKLKKNMKLGNKYNLFLVLIFCKSINGELIILSSAINKLYG